MSKRSVETEDATARRLISRVVPREEDGKVLGFVATTFDLCPKFFDEDFLPTLLGVQSLDDRSARARARMERKLADCDVSVVLLAASQYRGRPRSPRVGVHCLPRVAGGVQHAKVTLVAYENTIRLLVGSANLTTPGYRANREIVAELQAAPSRPRDAAVMLEALRGMPPELVARLREQPDVAGWLDAQRARLEVWAGGAGSGDLRFVWGGGETPLWQQVLSTWPAADQVERITVVSPFWSEEHGEGALARWVGALRERNALAANASIELVARAGLDGKHGWRPTLPPSFAGPAIRALGIPIRVHTAAPQAEEAEFKHVLSDRRLHAKVLLLSGQRGGVAYAGSANMSLQGWGLGGAANVEAGLLATFSADEADATAAALLPPTVGDPLVLTASVGPAAFAPVESEEGLEPPPWPAFVRSMELRPKGDVLVLEICLNAAGVQGSWAVSFDDGTAVAQGDVGGPGVVVSALDASGLRKLLRRPEVCVQWWKTEPGAPVSQYPVNVWAEARARLPFSADGRPYAEGDLVAYYQAKIDFEDLVGGDAEDGPGKADDDTGRDAGSSDVDTAKIQSYQIRAFVQALPGILRELSRASHSAAAMRTATRGTVSPLAVARAIVQAVDAGERTPVAGMFQLAEIRACLAEARMHPVAERNISIWTEALDRAEDELSQLEARVERCDGIAENVRLRLYRAELRTLHGEGE